MVRRRDLRIASTGAETSSVTHGELLGQMCGFRGVDGVEELTTTALGCVGALNGGRALSELRLASHSKFATQLRTHDPPSNDNPPTMVNRSYSKTYSVPRRPFESARLYVHSHGH